MDSEQISHNDATDLLKLLRGSPKSLTTTSAKSKSVRHVSQIKLGRYPPSKPTAERPIKVSPTIYIDVHRKPTNGVAKSAIATPVDQPDSPTPTLTPILPIHEGLYELIQRDVVTQLRTMKPRFSGEMPSIENLIFAYAMAAVLRADVDEWQLFCMAPEWRRRRTRPSLSADDQANALWHVMRFLHGTGAAASLPVKQAMASLRSHWTQNVTPFDLHEILMREEKPSATTSVAVRMLDGNFSRQLLSLAPGTRATVHLMVSPRKGRAKHVFEIAGVHAEPL